MDRSANRPKNGVAVGVQFAGGKSKEEEVDVLCVRAVKGGSSRVLNTEHGMRAV